MNPQTPAPDGTDETPAGSTTATPAEKTDLATLPADVREYIESLRSEAKKHRLEKGESEKARQRQEAARLEADKEWEKLANKYKTDLDAVTPRAERLDAMEQFLKDSAQRRIDGLPKQFRSLVPDYDDPLKTLKWLEDNAAALALPAVPNLGAGDQGDRGKKPVELTDDQKAIAKRLRIPEAKYAEELRKEQSKRS